MIVPSYLSTTWESQSMWRTRAQLNHDGEQKVNILSNATYKAAGKHSERQEASSTSEAFHSVKKDSTVA